MQGLFKSNSDRRYIIGQKLYIVQERSNKPQINKIKKTKKPKSNHDLQHPNQNPNQQQQLQDSRT